MQHYENRIRNVRARSCYSHFRSGRVALPRTKLLPASERLAARAPCRARTVRNREVDILTALMVMQVSQLRIARSVSEEAGVCAFSKELQEAVLSKSPGLMLGWNFGRSFGRSGAKRARGSFSISSLAPPPRLLLWLQGS